jgi:hypothetical protein
MYAQSKDWKLEKVETEMYYSTSNKGFEISRAINLFVYLHEDRKARLLQIANIGPVHKIFSSTIQFNTQIA